MLVGVEAQDFDLRFSVVAAGGAFLGDGALGVTFDELFAFHEDRFESSFGTVMLFFVVNFSAIGIDDVMLFFVNFPAIPTKPEAAACGGILKLPSTTTNLTYRASIVKSSSPPTEIQPSSPPCHTKLSSQASTDDD